jgi:hypothetical protein
VKKATKKTFLEAHDVGDMPIMKRKKTLSPSELDDDNEL